MTIPPQIATATAAEPAGRPAQTVVESTLHPAKKTVLGLYVTSKEAWEWWQAEPGRVKLLDVRTPEELLFVGHPPMAWKVPLTTQGWEWSEEKGKFPMALLPDFVDRVREMAKPEDVLLAFCRSGGRSAMAANILAKAGFTNVYNVVDGVEGDLVEDPESYFNGRRMRNGWKNCGAPFTFDLTRERLLLPRVTPPEAGRG
jgi:rhodanese-related sulfurtransferase